MAEISKLASNGHHTFYLTVEETYVDNVNNQSTVSWSFGIESVNSSWDFYIIGGTIKINMNGEEIFNEYKQRDHDATGRTIWASGTKNIKHNDDGSKNLSFSFDYSQSSGMSYWTPGNASESGDMWLTHIPRYANITSFNVYQRDETSVTYSYSTDAAIDWVSYSLDNVNWHNLPGDGVVSGLAANSSYSFYLAVKRADSQQWTYSDVRYQTTYDYPHPISINDFIIGNPLTVEVYNPLGRTYNLQLISNVNGNEIGHYEGALTTLIGFNDEESKDKQYASIPNSQSGTYYVKVAYDNRERTLGHKTYSILLNTEEVIPKMPNDYTFPCEDVNEITTALTDDTYKVILGYSNIQTTIPVEYKAIAQKYSTMSSYKLSVGFGEQEDEKPYSDNSDVVLKVNKVQSNIVTLYAIDSRGSSLVLTRNMIPINYTAPVVKVSEAKVTRSSNGVGENVTLSFSGTYWNENFGKVTNSIKILKYKFKKTDSTEWSSEFDILENIVYNNNEFSYDYLIKGDTETLGFDIAESYNIEVTYGDELETKTFVLTLGSGNPNLAITKNGVSVKAPYDNNIGGAMQVHGDLVLVDGKIIDNSGKNGVILYENSSGSSGTITLSDSSTNYSYFEIYFRTNDGTNYKSMTKVNNPHSSIVTLLYTWTSSATTYIKAANIYINNDVITFYDNIQYFVSSNGMTYSGSANYVWVTKVVGYNNENYKVGNGVAY